MISNQDAIWRLMSLCESCKDASSEKCDDCLVKASIKAFNIKDRFEQADVVKAIEQKRTEGDEWFADSHNRMLMGYHVGFEDGYNQALADIRGEEK